MYKRIKNKSGFTLIELLAVIVIMGVLMMVAIPAMTRYIENAKRDVFADTAKKYIGAVRYTLLSDGYECVDPTNSSKSVDCGLTDLAPSGKKLVIPANLIELENDTEKSPWGKTFDGKIAWIIVENTGTADTPKYTYYFTGTDASKNGINKVVEENSISRSVVKKANSTAATNPCSSSTECYLVSKLK